jgi:hypothetical protein
VDLAENRVDMTLIAMLIGRHGNFGVEAITKNVSSRGWVSLQEANGLSTTQFWLLYQPATLPRQLASFIAMTWGREDLE